MHLMEYDEYKTQASSTRVFLRQQLKEQAKVCDVTVKVGSWEKMFHWCVLISSPFFCCIYNTKLSEGSTDELHIELFSKSTVESAIMFLYGKKPDLTMVNISDMLDIAEFLLLPNLKSFCITWMERCKLTLENCTELFKLASLYDIYLKKCEEFITGHLTTLLEHGEMLNLTKDSVRLLLADPKFSYVNVEQKYHFLRRWVYERKNRLEDFKELFLTLDFTDFNELLLDEMKEDPLIKCWGEKMEFHSNTMCLNKRRVLISHERLTNSSKCFDIEKKEWFRLNTEIDDHSRDIYLEMNGSKGEDFSDIYYIDRSYNKCDVYVFDLANETLRKTEVVTPGDISVNFTNYDICKVSVGTFVACKHDNISIKSTTERVENTIDIPMHLALMSLSDTFLEQILAQLIIRQRLNEEVQNTTTLYLGNLFDGPDQSTIARPILSLKTKVDKIAINDTGCVAMFSKETNSVYLFDIHAGNLEQVTFDNTQKWGYGIRLTSCNNGFVLYDNKCAVSIIRLQGACIQEKYRVFTKQLADKNVDSNAEYRLIANVWYRQKDENKFSCVSHEKMMLNDGNDDDGWTPLSLTEEGNRSLSTAFRSEIFMISIPKHKLRCHIECPHCQAIQNQAYSRSYGRTVEKGETSSYYDSSDDEDRYVYGTDYYYYESD